MESYTRLAVRIKDDLRQRLGHRLDNLEIIVNSVSIIVIDIVTQQRILNHFYDTTVRFSDIRKVTEKLAPFSKHFSTPPSDTDELTWILARLREIHNDQLHHITLNVVDGNLYVRDKYHEKPYVIYSMRPNEYLVNKISEYIVKNDAERIGDVTPVIRYHKVPEYRKPEDKMEKALDYVMKERKAFKKVIPAPLPTKETIIDTIVDVAETTYRKPKAVII